MMRLFILTQLCTFFILSLANGAETPPNMDSGISPENLGLLQTIAHTLTETAAVTKNHGERIAAIEAKLGIGKTATAPGPLNPHFYLSLESPDGKKTTTPITKLTAQKDFQMPGSAWRCFAFEPKTTEHSVTWMSKCISKRDPTVAFLVPLTVSDAEYDPIKASDVTLVAGGPKRDYRVQLIYTSQPLPAEELAPKKVQVD